MESSVRCAVIGCGGAAWMGHLPWIWAHPHAVLAAVCDSAIDRARQAQARYQVPLATAKLTEILERDDIDAVCICTPPGLHHDMVITAAEHGKHVLLEKPMGRSVSECRAMIAAAAQHNIILMLGHEKRFNTALEQIKATIDANVLGQPFHLTIQWGSAVKLAPDLLIPDGYRESYMWRWKDKGVGGGILQDHLPHYVDLWRWWTGAEVESVFAEAQYVSRDYLNQPEIGMWEDFGVVLMRFTNGATGVFETGTVGTGLSPILHNTSLRGAWAESGNIYGTRGQVTFDLPPWDSSEHGRVMVRSLEDRTTNNRGWYEIEMPDARRAPGGPLSPVTNENYMFWRQIDHFVSCIQNQAQPRITGYDGLATLAVVEAVYDSHRSGQRVQVQSN